MSVIDYSWDFTREEFSLDLDFFNEKEQEDKMWQARTGLTHETLCGAIETIIFMNDRPVTLQKIKASIDSDLPLRVVHDCIARLQEEYEQKHHGIRLMEVAQGYQFRTKATYSSIVQRMFKVSSLQLSPTALEVLAIIAYKQPISKTSIETIRGVDSSHIVRALMDKRLVKVVGRSEELGRPSLLGTTTEFLEVFNLSDIIELPTENELDELASASSVASIGEIKDVVQKGDKAKFNFDELGELDVLTESIKAIATDTIFTKTLTSEQKVKAEEGEIRKSAFDILEEYLVKKEIIEQNQVAVDSDTIMSVFEAKVVNVTLDSEQMFNLPQEDEDFSIDDRELPELKELSSEEEELIHDIVDETMALKEEAQREELESLFADSDLEAKQLADELDMAFENLFASHTSEYEEELLKEDKKNAELIEEGMSELEESLQNFAERAKDLDLDVDFLSDK